MVLSCILILVLFLIKMLNTKTILTHSVQQLENVDKYSAEELVTLLSSTAKMFVENLNKHTRIVLMRSVCEAVIVLVHLLFLISISIMVGLPWKNPYPNGFDCSLLIKTTRGNRNDLFDRVTTHCVLGMHKAYSIGYIILWTYIMFNIVLGTMIILFRLLLNSSLAVRIKYLSFQLGNNILGLGELFAQLVGALGAHDYVMLLHIRSKFGGKNAEKFTDFCKRVHAILVANEPEG